MEERKEAPIGDGAPAPRPAAPTAVIISIGSRYMQFGLSTSLTPSLLPHCIAYRRLGPAAAGAAPIAPEAPHGTDGTTDADRMAEAMRLRRSLGKMRPEWEVKEGKGEGHVVWSGSAAAALRGSASKFLVGEDALKVASSPEWQIRFPILRGRFNFPCEYYASPQQVLDDLERIWRHALWTRFQLKHFAEYAVVLVMRDLWCRKEVILITQMLLGTMGFRQFFMHQQSACAAFGAGVSGGIVVDVGDQVCTVSCVMDGYVLPKSRVWLPYGIFDVGEPCRACFWDCVG